MNITVLGLAPTCMRQHSPSSVSDQILGGRSHKNFNPNCVGSDRIFDIQILTTANNSSILHLNTNHLELTLCCSIIGLVWILRKRKALALL